MTLELALLAHSPLSCGMTPSTCELFFLDSWP
jgi:hypothetical protein